MSDPFRNPNFHGARIALVHDWLNQRGGAENVLEEFVDLFPGAPVYTSIYAPDRMPAPYREWDVRTSFMQRLPGVAAHHQRYLPLYPLAFQRTDLREYDIVLSNKSGFCHGVQTGNAELGDATHICYCLSPTRFLWLYQHYQEREQFGRLTSLGLQPLLASLRWWDWQAAQRVDYFIAISSEIGRRIRNIYDRDSVIIHPPVDTEYFAPSMGPGGYFAPSMGPGNAPEIGDYYLIVSRLVPYKRIDLAVQAFARLPHERLVVVGSGRDRDELEASAPDNVTFLGGQSRERVRELMQGCKAFLFPGLEDFGIAPVEAMAAGRPVIAFAGGGALDTVAPGISGEHFAEQTVDSLYETLSCFDASAYNPAACRAQAELFSTANFRRRMKKYVELIASKRERTARDRLVSQEPVAADL